MFKSVTKLIKVFMEQGWGFESPWSVISQEKLSPALTDGVHAGHDGDDRAVVVTVIKNIQHRGPITLNP